MYLCVYVRNGLLHYLCHLFASLIFLKHNDLNATSLLLESYNTRCNLLDVLRLYIL